MPGRRFVSAMALLSGVWVACGGGAPASSPECGNQIAEARLRALPFAVRCRDCEEAREAAELRERVSQRRGSSALFVNMVN